MAFENDKKLHHIQGTVPVQTFITLLILSYNIRSNVILKFMVNSTTFILCTLSLQGQVKDSIEPLLLIKKYIFFIYLTIIHHYLSYLHSDLYSVTLMESKVADT